MNPVSLACEVLGGLIQLTIGLRLLWLWRRTRGSAEFLWGSAWLIAAVDHSIGSVAMLTDDPQLKAVVLFAIRLIYTVDIVVLFLAVWRIFRPDEGWARVLSLAAGGGLLLNWAYQLTVVGLGTPFFAGKSALILINHGAMVVVMLWTAIEGFLHYRMFLKRWRIGLADVLMARRFLMWCGSAATIMMLWLIIWARILFPVPALLIDISVPTFSLISAGLMWLTFFPPDWLRGGDKGTVP